MNVMSEMIYSLYMHTSVDLLNSTIIPRTAFIVTIIYSPIVMGTVIQSI